MKQLPKQGYSKNRERFIEKMLIAMQTSIELINGANFSVKDQYLRIYDIDLQPVNEQELDNIKNEIDEAYKGPGSLEDRMANLRVKRRVPEAKVFNLFNKALKIVRKQTKKLFYNLLPDEEKITIDLVKKSDDELKWSFYNWYLGNYHSRIEVYPGHHTEFVLNEQKLYNEQNQFEHSILLLQSPKLIICEGIADLAINVLFSYKKSAEISLKDLCPFTLKDESLDTLILQNKVRGKTTLFWYNLAYHALIDNWDVNELIQYARNFEIYSEESIKNQLNIMCNPAHSLTVFSYNIGTNLIIKKYGEFPSVRNFQNLLVNPILPSDLV